MADRAVRRLRQDEAEAAARIHRAARETVACIDDSDIPIKELETAFRNIIFPRTEMTGCFEDGTMRGFIAWHEGWIMHLYVDPDRHSRGIGSALIDLAKAAFDDIQLWTFAANGGARRFYERHGFFAEEFTDGARNEEKEPDIRYRWRQRDGR